MRELYRRVERVFEVPASDSDQISEPLPIREARREERRFKCLAPWLEREYSSMLGTARSP